jgi:DNA-directed RNA polymerase specialized sigma24 family protein
MLKDIAKYHSEWINMVRSMGGGNYSEDMVQDMYIKIHKYATPQKIYVDGKVNKFYIYLTLRSIVYTEFRNKENIKKESIDHYLHLADTTNDITEMEAFNNVSSLIYKDMNHWHWYDKALFEIYRDNKISIRKIADKTGISWVSIFHTLKKCKNKIRDNHSENWQDFINEDYEHLK